VGGGWCGLEGEGDVEDEGDEAEVVFFAWVDVAVVGDEVGGGGEDGLFEGGVGDGGKVEEGLVEGVVGDGFDGGGWEVWVEEAPGGGEGGLLEVWEVGVSGLGEGEEDGDEVRASGLEGADGVEVVLVGEEPFVEEGFDGEFEEGEVAIGEDDFLGEVEELTNLLMGVFAEGRESSLEEEPAELFVVGDEGGEVGDVLGLGGVEFFFDDVELVGLGGGVFGEEEGEDEGGGLGGVVGVLPEGGMDVVVEGFSDLMGVAMDLAELGDELLWGGGGA
jgi:hypothetical protein